jgi:hypothetical protein
MGAEDLLEGVQRLTGELLMVFGPPNSIDCATANRIFGHRHGHVKAGRRFRLRQTRDARQAEFQRRFLRTL